MDKEIVIKRLEYIRDKVRDLDYDLSNYENIDSEREKKTIRGAVERWCEEIVESGVMINNELLSLKHKVPDSYYNSFIGLRELDIFDEDFLKQLASTAGYRNRLAHDYMNVDARISIHSAKMISRLYKDYIQTISELLEQL